MSLTTKKHIRSKQPVDGRIRSNENCISNAKQICDSKSFLKGYEEMKEKYSKFMEVHGNKMQNFYSDWDVNAVKGLIQTGRFAHYTDEILDDLLQERIIYVQMQNHRFSFRMNDVHVLRENVFGVVAPPCAGKSTTVNANQDVKDALVLDGSWLIGTASRQLLAKGIFPKFRFSELFGEHTREKHVQCILELFPQIIDRVNKWLDEFETQMNKLSIAHNSNKILPTLIFHSNPKIFQFINVPNYSAIYSDTKDVLKAHVKKRHAGDPPEWINIRLDWFYQCNVHATASLENVPSILKEEMTIRKISTRKQLEKTMEMYPKQIAQKHGRQIKLNKNRTNHKYKSFDMKDILTKIMFDEKY